MARKVTLEQLRERERKLREQMTRLQAEDDRRIAKMVRKYLSFADLEDLEKMLSDWAAYLTEDAEGDEYDESADEVAIGMTPNGVAARKPAVRTEDFMQLPGSQRA